VTRGTFASAARAYNRGEFQIRREAGPNVKTRDRIALSFVAVLLLTGSAAFGLEAPAAQASPAQADASNLAFDVASVRVSAPMDMQKVAADMQAGKMPNVGMHIKGLRADYNYLTMKDLITVAYKVKPVQITGPAWLATEHFDIAAKMPDGSSKDDAPAMLRALLAERFKLVVHRQTQERQVLTLVVGKSGPKMKESPGDAPPIDPDAPLKPGEMQVDTQDGPARMTMNKNGMGATMNMGTKGIITYSVDTQTMMLHLTSSKTTMEALADMLTQMMTQIGGSSGSQVLDMTGLKGNYEVAMDFSLADMVAAARAQGIDVPGGHSGGPSGAAVASDPGGGGSSVNHSVETLGLKLDQRKSPVEQIIVDSAEKTPTEN
jgi:uncharacterized protein (TIGR03435 family)